MPKFAPLIKVNNCEELGANVVLHGKDFAEAKARAHEIAKEKGLAYIDGYDDPARGLVADGRSRVWKFGCFRRARSLHGRDAKSSASR